MTEFKIESVHVEYNEDTEINASKIDFSSDENIELANNSLREMGVLPEGEQQTERQENE